MLFSSLKPHRLYTCHNKTNPSLFIDKTYYSNSLPKTTLVEANKPLLSFTSFQHYLEDCNQNEFYKREFQRVHRSANKAKTQAHFNYQREKSNSSDAKRKHIKNFILEDSVVEPFENCQSTSNKHKNIKLNRNIGSKSSSDNYVHQNSFAENIFNQKYGTIDGWNSEQKLYNTNDQKVNFVSSKNILQQRKLNSIIKNRNQKTSQNSFRKQPKQPQAIQPQTNYPKPPKIPTQTHLSTTKKPRPKKSSNKQNICLTQSPSTIPQNQDQLFRPIQIHQKQTSKNQHLTSINELEQQILLSKRQPQFMNSFSSRGNKTNDDYYGCQVTEVKENQNIKMLKKEFQYLCRDDFDDRWDGSQKTPLSSIEQKTSLKNINKQLKYFKRFPIHENNNEFKTQYPFDNANPLKTNRPKTTHDDTNQSSSNMLRILQSINYTTSNEKCLYQSKTPVKRKNLPQTNVNTPHNVRKDDMKSISKHKERFHESLKDRKSRSAFHCGSGNGQGFQGMQNERDKRENSLIITVVSSFKSCDSKTRTRQKLTGRNFSLLNNNKNSRLMTEQPFTSQQTSQQSSLFQKPFLPQHPIPHQDPQTFNDMRLNQSMCQTIDIMHSVSEHDNMINEHKQSLQKLNILSQQLKKCAKMPVSTKYISLGSKKFVGRMGRVNKKDKMQSILKEERKNVIKNLTITQLEGRHIEKLRKRFDLNNP